MFDVFRLIPPLQVIFTYEIEFDEDSFAKLTGPQYEAFVRREGKPKETVYRVTAFEPKAVERTADKVTMELSVVTESERKLLLDAMQYVYRKTSQMKKENPTFVERLDYLRRRLPPIVTSKPN